jgi:hypothetical protein
MPIPPEQALYQTETTPFEEAWNPYAEMQEYIARVVEDAWRVLGARDYPDRKVLEAIRSRERAVPLLLGDTEGDLEAHLAASILVHHQRMQKALNTAQLRAASGQLEIGDLLNLQRQVMLFTQATDRAIHQDAFGPAVGQRRKHVALNRGNAAREHEHQAQTYAKWQARYHAMIAEGWKPSAARAKIADAVAEAGVDVPTDKILRKWFPTPPG